MRCIAASSPPGAVPTSGIITEMELAGVLPAELANTLVALAITSRARLSNSRNPTNFRARLRLIAMVRDSRADCKPTRGDYISEYYLIADLPRPRRPARQPRPLLAARRSNEAMRPRLLEGRDRSRRILYCPRPAEALTRIAVYLFVSRC